jgi:phosphate starvation-inducible protein PhoH
LRPATKPVEVVFTPVDNQRLANLCGTLDENLRQIEAAFDVAIQRRGERFSLDGKPGGTRAAAEAPARLLRPRQEGPVRRGRAARPGRGAPQ